MSVEAPVADRPIGVFDSGVGGLSVLRSLREALPHERYAYFADTGHSPYGERADGFVVERSLAVARELIEDRGAKALVVACNTATAAAIHLLRERYPQLPIVGVEPALKPAAAASRTGRVVVLATRGTLASVKFAALHARHASDARFILQPCDGLAAAIEAGDDERVRRLVSGYVEGAGPYGARPGEADTVVLGCTHYPFAADAIGAAAGPGVTLIDTGMAVALRTRDLLAARGLIATAGAAEVDYLTTGDASALQAAVARWLPGEDD